MWKKVYLFHEQAHQISEMYSIYIYRLETSQQSNLTGCWIENEHDEKKKKKKYIYIYIGKRLLFHGQTDGIFELFLNRLETSKQPILQNVRIGKEHDNTVQMKK